MISHYARLPSTAYAQYGAHLLRLNAEDRRLRFHGAVVDASVLQHVAALPGEEVVIIAYMVDDVPRGCVEVMFSATGPGAIVELAFSVERPWQCSGIGTALARQALALAIERAACRAGLSTLPENKAMQRVAQKVGGILSAGDGVVDVDFPMPTPAADRAEIAAQPDPGPGRQAIAVDRLLADSRAAATPPRHDRADRSLELT